MSEHTISASATGSPTEREILEVYREWLHYEGRLLGKELYPDHPNGSRLIIHTDLATRFHFPQDKRWNEAPPSTRARLILQAVGILSQDGADDDGK